jgi:hypothetical protein
MDLDLTPAIPAMLCKSFDQSRVILLGRIEICVTERKAVGVTPFFECLRNLAAPAFQPLLLYVCAGSGLALFRKYRRLEVVCKA